ncbi:MAG: S8 family peptidase, partial [Muribaculaceae bacterium]|nr:S8 family peptidase [Muribaculaceae bacterium]
HYTMMRKVIVSAVLIAGFTMWASAGSKISLADRGMLKRAALEQPSVLESQDATEGKSRLSGRKRSVGISSRVGAVVELSSGYSVEDLEAAGVTVLNCVGRYAVVETDRDSLVSLSDKPSVKRMAFGRKAQFRNHNARTQTSVETIHGGTQLNNVYDGSGVVCGIFDGGVDPNHPAFKTSDGSASRVKELYKYSTRANNQMSLTVYSGSQLASFTTDDSSESHGTHTTGSMAGGTYGNSTYYGMAPNADIVIGCGDSDFSYMVDAMARIAKYGKEHGQPVVINCSMGHNVGPHDGSDVYSAAMNESADEYGAIICIAAGNEADMPIAANKKFTAADRKLKTALVSNHYYGSDDFYSETEYWLSDARPVKVTLALVNKNTGAVEELCSVDKVTDDYNEYGMVYVMNSSQASTEDGDVTNSVFDAAFSSSNYNPSYMMLGTTVDPDNGHYNVYVGATLNYKSAETYLPAVIIEGNEGQEIWGYNSGYEQQFATGLSGWDDGTIDGSINGFACAEKTIAVGAWTVTRQYYSASAGKNMTYNSGQTVGNVTDWSSFGTTRDGRDLPHVCAPGSIIVSSVNSYDKSSFATADYSSNASVDGRSAPYAYMQGTSMATPVLTGAMALWKQAKPDLTVGEAIDIIRKTADRDSYVAAAAYSKQWGAGKFNAYEGLKEVIRSAGIADLEADGAERMTVIPCGDRLFDIFVAGELSLRATLYSVSGAVVSAISAQGDTLRLDASALADGVYILTVDGASSRYSRRLLVK